VYAVGLLAYELLRGASPFSGSSPQATLAAQLTERPAPPHVVRSDVPPALSRVIMLCLEKDAEKRPATAAELLALLEDVERQIGGQVAAASLSRTRTMLLAAAVLFVAATAVFALSRRGTDRATGARAGASTALRAAAPAETVVVYQPVPVRDDPTSVTVPLVLSPAESTAILQAYRAGAAAGRAEALLGADDIDRDSLVAAVSRLFADSMARAIARLEEALAASPRQQALQSLAREMQGLAVADAPTDDRSVRVRVETGRPPSARPPLPESLRGRMNGVAATITPLIPPPPPGTRRLAILGFADRTRTPALATLGAQLLDSIAAELRSTRGMRLEIIPADATERLLGATPMRATTAGFALRANYVLGGTYFVRNDSLHVITVLTDVQGGAETRAHAEALPLGGDATQLIGPTSRWVRARLDSLRRDMGGRMPPPGFDGPRPR
jgi:serine/threonine-protein kinase